MKDDLNRKESIINLRIEHDLKDDSRSVLYGYGLSHSKAIRYFLEHITEIGEIPQVLREYIESREKRKLNNIK